MRRRRILTSLAIAATLAVAAIALFLARLRAQPDWYAPVAATDGAAVRAAAAEAERFEYRVAESLQRIRPAATTWTLELSDAEMNAWLATRLDDWLVQQGNGGWPPSLGVPQLHTTTEGMWLGAPVRVGPGAFASSRVVPRLDGDAVVLELRDTALGGFTYDRAGEAIAELAEAYGAERVAALGFDAPALRRGEIRGEPELPLADGRRARIESWALGDGALVLTLRTLPKSSTP